jgi:hypothetical protein
MADLYAISKGTGKVYRFDGTSWALFASAPASWASTNNNSTTLFAYRGKLHAFVGVGATGWYLYRLESNGSWTSLATMARVVGWYCSGAARYRGKIYLPLIHDDAQMRLLEWNGSTISGDNASSGVWCDAPAYNASYTMPHMAGRLVAWRERLLLGQVGNNPIPGGQEQSNFLYAIDPTAGAGIAQQKLLGGPDGAHLTSIIFPTGANVTMLNGVIKTHLGFGTYNGKVYVLGTDGGVRELPPNQTPTAAPIFTFKSAFPVMGPYTAHATANPDANGLRVAATSGGFPFFRWMLIGAEITCDGRVGICTGLIASDPYTLYLRDPSTDLLMGNFPAGASYTVKQGLGIIYSTGATYYGNPAYASFHEYNGCLYVLICGTQTGAVSGVRCPSILAKWDGVSASFTAILVSAAYLDAAGTNVVVDPATGYMHIVYFKSVSQNALDWRHVTVDLNPTTPVVLYSASFASESGLTIYIGQASIADSQAVLFTYDRPTAEVTATSYNALQNKMTVTYSLYDDSSNACNVTIETDYGAGWFEATRKGSEGEGKTGLTSSPSGVEHTFVHDLGADGSPQVTRIQYKVTATQA